MLAVAGFVALVRRRGIPFENALLLCAFIFALSALESRYYVEGRRRWAVEPLLLVLSGGAAMMIVRRRAI